MSVRVRNVQAGFYNATGFHPLRGSRDYDPDRPSEFDTGARTDAGGLKYKPGHKPPVRKARSKSRAKGKKRNPGREPMVVRAKDGRIIQRSRNLAGIRRASGQYPMETINLTKLPGGEGSLFIRFKDYGTANPWDGATFETKFADYTVLKSFVSRWRNVKGVPVSENPGRNPRTKFYEVIVGNIGKVHQGGNKAAALRAYAEYVQQSKSGRGRAGGEDVSLWIDNEPVKEHYGTSMESNPGKKARRIRATSDARSRAHGIGKLRGPRSIAKLKYKRASSARRRQSRNPASSAIKVYKVSVPRTSTTPGYQMQIRAKKKTTAVAEARAYCTRKHGKAPKGITATQLKRAA